MPFSFLPRMIYPHLTDVRAEDLTARGISFLMLDFDNTIVPYTTSEPTEEFLHWKEQLAHAGISMMVVSNSRKSRRVPDFCEKWDIPWIRHAGKPNPKGIRSAMERMGQTPAHTAMAGDQTFTDILGGNLAGVTSILVYPLYFSNPFQRIRYGIERPFIAMGRKKRKR